MVVGVLFWKFNHIHFVFMCINGICLCASERGKTRSRSFGQLKADRKMFFFLVQADRKMFNDGDNRDNYFFFSLNQRINYIWHFFTKVYYIYIWQTYTFSFNLFVYFFRQTKHIFCLSYKWQVHKYDFQFFPTWIISCQIYVSSHLINFSDLVYFSSILVSVEIYYLYYYF